MKFPTSGRSQSGRPAGEIKNIRELAVPLMRARVAHELIEQCAGDVRLVPSKRRRAALLVLLVATASMGTVPLLSYTTVETRSASGTT